MRSINIRYSSTLCLVILFISASAVHPSDIRNPFEYGKKIHKKVKRGDSLEIILISGEEKIAVFGGKEYTVGDRLGKYMVMNINIDHIEITSKSKTKRLYLNDEL